MPGIQSRGRTRITTNKIEQIKTQNKASPTPPPATPQEKSTYQNKIAHGQQSHKSQNQIKSTESNIAKAVIVKKAKTRPKLINRPKSINTPGLTPLGKFGLGAQNQVTDYQGLVNWDHKSKSILNQSIEKAFEGDWDGAGKLIQNNPYRFAGNLAVEVGTAFIPATWGLKAVKYGAQVGKTVIKSKNIGVMNKVTPKDTAIQKLTQMGVKTPIHKQIKMNVQKRVKNYKDNKNQISNKETQKELPTVNNKSETPQIILNLKDSSGVVQPHVISKMRNPLVEGAQFFGTKRDDAYRTFIFTKVTKSSNNAPDTTFISVTSRGLPFADDYSTTMSNRSIQSTLTQRPDRKAVIMGKEEVMKVMKNANTQAKIVRKNQMNEGTLASRTGWRRTFVSTDSSSQLNFRSKILLDKVKRKFGKTNTPLKFSAEGEEVSMRIRGSFDVTHPDTITLGRYNAGATPAQTTDTLVHESIHKALSLTGDGSTLTKKGMGSMMFSNAGLYFLTYMSKKGDQRKLVSALNKESYTMNEIKKMSPDKLDLLIREQKALGNTDKFSTGNKINWKKSGGQEIRRSRGHLSGFDSVISEGRMDAWMSKLSPDANTKVMTEFTNSPFKSAKDTFRMTTNEPNLSHRSRILDPRMLLTRAREIDRINFDNDFISKKVKIKHQRRNDVFDVIKNTSFGTMGTFNVLNKISLAKENKDNKPKYTKGRYI